MTKQNMLEYIKDQYLTCKREWHEWCECAEMEINATSKQLAKRFANEEYAKANMLEVMAHDMFGFDLFGWYLNR